MTPEHPRQKFRKGGCTTVDAQLKLCSTAHHTPWVGGLQSDGGDEFSAAQILAEKGGFTGDWITVSGQQLQSFHHDEARDDGIGGCDGVDDVASHAFGVEERLCWDVVAE